MRCYYVCVHGKLDWVAMPSADDEFGALQPAGFYCHRYVLAPDEKQATAMAYDRVRTNLDKQFGWVRDGLANLHLDVDEVSTAPIHKLLKPDNRGHTFYEKA